MAILEILRFPDPNLRLRSETVDQVTEELKKFSQDMLETMLEHRGIGLAAPQVNKRIRLLITDTRIKDEEGRYILGEQTEYEKKIKQPLIIFNPEIIKSRGTTTYDEGCLSIPSYFETVTRYEHIEVKGLDQDGKLMKFEVDGLLSICIQHEIDHLDGKLFIDRLSTLKSERIKRKIKKLGYPEPEEHDEREL